MTAPRVRVSDEIAWATSQLAEVGVASPRADAEWLMCYVLRIDRGRLLIADDLSDDQACPTATSSPGAGPGSRCST